MLGVFVGIGIGVGATTLLNSNQVLYKNNTTVEEALNDLYTKSIIGDATASDIKSGKKALVGGKEVTGSLTCPTCPSYTSLSGTQSVGAGGSSSLLNGYYYLTNYKIQCGSNSCSACNSCCSSNIATGTFWAANGTITVNTSKTINQFVVVSGWKNSSSNNYDTRRFLYIMDYNNKWVQVGNSSDNSTWGVKSVSGSSFTFKWDTDSLFTYWVY